MKSRFILALFGLVLLLACSTAFLYQKSAKLKQETERLSDNQSSLLSSFQTLKTEAGHNAASVGALTLKVKELKGQNTRLQQTADELGVKLKRVQSYSTTATETKVAINVPVKDSTINTQDSSGAIRQEPVKCFEYADNWVNISGCVGTKFTGTFCNKDTIQQIVDRVPKKFLFIRYGTKGIRQQILSRNPYTTIAYTEYIELKK